VRRFWAGIVRGRTNLMRTVSYLFAVSSMVCFIAAALVFARMSDAGMSRGALRFASVHQSLGDLPAGVEFPVSFAVTNESSRSVTLLGVTQFCEDWGCVYASGFPVTLAPRSSSTISVGVRTRAGGRTGNFAAEVILYSDCPGFGQIQLSIAGNIVPVPES
jgi:hypothetical protein